MSGVLIPKYSIVRIFNPENSIVESVLGEWIFNTKKSYSEDQKYPSNSRKTPYWGAT